MNHQKANATITKNLRDILDLTGKPSDLRIISFGPDNTSRLVYLKSLSKLETVQRKTPKNAPL
jgi:hypothetical protein